MLALCHDRPPNTRCPARTRPVPRTSRPRRWAPLPPPLLSVALRSSTRSPPQKEYLRRGARAMYPESFETSLQLGQSVLEGFNTSSVDIKSIKAEVRGDSGMEETFEEYEEWYKKNIR
ncbi:hypothetical protein BWQ96_10447 [Gracilariopsis chorda]|uniref:Uncharacterized protein n=1 Tax=Gracilariopsis chorda TaxID=448386 RepID=A0A2V3ICG7_9FLOR|nr:hypothetical protein BWQ96_10566 [Gracilariopsis chorda]PXF39837.1 hypothetical protein BWQ96_10447 [Gracilariopsis chorda]|eukprot:PXF39728.1 hypothetical protein BWQ96_10566 [Gracilariopsis chorda]